MRPGDIPAGAYIFYILLFESQPIMFMVTALVVLMTLKVIAAIRSFILG